tara:strand:+ start:9153 stop:9452 length:300 start_codon:yes stop_codon:yes gene_type:complete
MALTGYPKTYETPKIHIHSGSGAMSSALTGIFDLIKHTSSDPNDKVSIEIKKPGDSAETTIHVTAGDVVEGPFVSVKALAGGDVDGEVWIYERSSIVTD